MRNSKIKTRNRFKRQKETKRELAEFEKEIKDNINSKMKTNVTGPHEILVPRHFK